MEKCDKAGITHIIGHLIKKKKTVYKGITGYKKDLNFFVLNFKTFFY